MRNIGSSAFITLVAGLASVAHADLQASATLQLASTGGTVTSPTYTYNLVMHDTGTTGIGTFWFAWLPGEDFMKTSPISEINPAGWSSQVTGGGTNNGYAILWTASSTAAETAAGGTLSGFSFTSADDPVSISGNSIYYTTTPVETTVVYSHGIFSDAGFVLQTATVPEPTLVGGAALLLMLRRRGR